jgi:hypothetical protein
MYQSDWQRPQTSDQLCTGAAIYNLLRHGYRLFDIVDALDLGACYEAQLRVALFILHFERLHGVPKISYADIRAARAAG